MRLFLATLSCLSLFAQAPRGTLHFTSAARQVELQVLDGNHPALIALRPEQGEAAILREFVLTHTGPEKMIAPQATPLKTIAPAAWKVSKHRGTKLLQSGETIYWCYTPGLVLPVTFRIGLVTWKLQSAELPPLMFVEVR